MNSTVIRLDDDMFEKCPECGNYSLAYDEYYKRFMCFRNDCMASELSSEKIREIAKNRIR